MKQTWITDPNTIRSELYTLIDQGLPLRLYQRGQQQQAVNAEAVTADETGESLVLAKASPFAAAAGICFFLYQSRDQLVHGFSGPLLNQDERSLTIPVPEEIFQIQRRKHPRVTTTAKSRATFLYGGGQRPITVDVKDVCLEGARLNGSLPDRLAVGQVLGPITMSLHLQFSRVEAETVQVPGATVVRLHALAGGRREMAIHFVLPAEEREVLERYVYLRQLEVETQAKVCPGKGGP